jgi:hypothetical protein
MSKELEIELLFSIVKENLEILQSRFSPIKNARLFNQLGFLSDQTIEAHRLFKLSTSEIPEQVRTKTGQLVELLDSKRRASGEKDD